MSTARVAKKHWTSLCRPQSIEQARIRRQLALEKSLAEQLKQPMLLNCKPMKFVSSNPSSTSFLQSFRTGSCWARYQKNPETPAVDYSSGVALPMIKSYRSLKVYEFVWSWKLNWTFCNGFPCQTRAQEEIEYILNNSKFSDEKSKILKTLFVIKMTFNCHTCIIFF